MHNTRDRILAYLKRQPNASVEALANTLSLAHMTIRQHLAQLMGDGLVESESERRRRGRPAFVYRLTPAGDDRFPKAYDRLAALLLEVAGAAGLEGAARSPQERRALLLQRAAARAAEPHLPALTHLPTAQRTLAAVAILQAESGMAELDPAAPGVTVREYNCIYQRVAEHHQDVCAFHTEYVSQLMGAPVELDSCQCLGANACVFRVDA